MNKILSDAMQVFGWENQKVKAIEELSELQKEICKDILDQGTRDHICEEIADVEIMLEQLRAMFDYGDRVNSYKKAKIKRLAETIEDRRYIGTDDRDD